MTKRLAALFLAATLLPMAAPAREDPEPPPPKVEAREIHVKSGLHVRSDFGEPIRVKTKEQLAAVLSNKQTEAAIRQEVKFGKEHLLIFCWAGGGGDQLEAKGKDGEVVFEYVQAERKESEIVLHSRMFAVPARAKVRLVKK